MSVTSLNFLCFIAFSVLIYYLLPEKRKPGVLLLLSFLFIASYDVRGIAFLAATAFLIWRCGLRLEALQNSQEDDKQRRRKRRSVLLVTVILTAGILVVLKYLGPITAGLFFPRAGLRFFVPIGLSYYTLQAISYVVDVYWGRVPAERKYHRLLLFLCYFPQILQGPISRYGDLSRELFEKNHQFRVQNLKYGVQLILWGCFKLLVVGDKTHVIVSEAFHSGSTAYGLAAFLGLMFFGFELYANFSGGIDIIRGVSQCFGITLAENFRQPFFSRSLGEFWRRWHITLGTWMKDYIFYPISMSRPMSRFKKKLKLHMDRKMANRIPIALTNILVFLLVGLWHGLGTNYVIWGLYNGIILAFSEVMALTYEKAKKRLSISSDGKLWNGFCLLRTFLIITIGWCTDCADTASGSAMIIVNMLQLTRTDFGIFHASAFGFAKAIFSIALMVLVDLIHEKGYSVRDEVGKRHYLLQILFWTALIQLIACFGRTATLGGLMYAGF